MAQTKKEKGIDQMLDEALVNESEWPYKVPDNWVWVKLGYIAQWGSGGTPSRKNEEYYNGTIKWIKTGELKNEIIFDTEEKITESGLNKSSAKLFPKDSVAIAMYGATIGQVGILGVEAATNQACAVAIPHKDIVDHEYLFYYLISEKDNFVKLGKGGAQPNISQTIIKNFESPLPPFREQKRIVKKLLSMLSKSKEAGELVHEAKDSFEKRRAAILNKAFNGELTKKWREENSDVRNNYFDKNNYNHPPYQIPTPWKWVKFKDVAEVKSKLVSPIEYSSLPHIAPNSIEKFTGKLISYNTIEEDGVTSPKHFFYKGQIIYSKIRPNLSKLIISEFDGLCSADMYPISTILNLKYLFHYMLSNTFLDFASNAGTRTILPKINQKELYSLPVPCPSIGEQKEIVKILDNLLIKEDKIAELIDLENHYDLLEKSILSKAFRGELDTNNLNDEPAIKLLEKALQSKIPLKIKIKEKIKVKTAIQAIKVSTDEFSENGKVLLNFIKNRFGHKPFKIKEVRKISELSYEELKEALFELIKEPLDGKSKAKLKMNWAKGYLVQLSE